MKTQDKIFIHGVLKRLEWEFEKMGQPCPICEEGYKYGHKEDCELNKSIDILLKTANEEKI